MILMMLRSRTPFSGVRVIPLPLGFSRLQGRLNQRETGSYCVTVRPQKGVSNIVAMRAAVYGCFAPSDKVK